MKCLADALVMGEAPHAVGTQALLDAYSLLVRVGVCEENEPILDAMERELEHRGVDLVEIGAE